MKMKTLRQAMEWNEDSSGRMRPVPGTFGEDSAARIRIRLHLRGLVQGVGFRPFLHRLAHQTGIKGWARNTSGGLEAELEGPAGQLELFMTSLKNSPPPQSVVEEISFTRLEDPKGYRDFSILESRISSRATLIGSDTAPCALCEKELFTPGDRRFGYAFINCTDCGPRYTIVKALPYDRSQTVMDRFPMCPDCLQEYGDITDRRYHAQPNCCPACGPCVFYLDADAFPREGDPVGLSRQLLNQGGILAIKGAGGIHLACDAENPDAVKRLRMRKNRPSRPLALMCPDTAQAEKICLVSEEEKKLLTSPGRPIVLLSKRYPGSYPDISFSSRLGVMLPYTPLHMLLFGSSPGCPPVLVMTSANKSGCPVLIRNEEALDALSGIADGYLFHNRPIQNRCDDSLVSVAAGEVCFFRRSRGYVPKPLFTEEDVTGICAFGAEQKASFAMGKGHHIFLSPHIGDIKNLETLDHYREAFQTFRQLFRITPSLLVCDLHPDYFSTQEAQKAAQEYHVPLIRVQHHWAHMESCRRDNGLEGRVFGIIWDGTGLGSDGCIWGGEFLTGDDSAFVRGGSIRPILLPGGDIAVSEPGRTALSLLLDAGLPACLAPLPPGKAAAMEKLLSSRTMCPRASSMGRLFDGILSLLLQKENVSYDGEAPARLEAMSPQEVPSQKDLEDGSPWPLVFYQEDGIRRFDTRPLVQAVVREREEGVSPGETARRFMLTLCHMALNQCRALTTQHLPVVLSGGVFLNRFLLEGIRLLLIRNGFGVYCHRQVSACDEGICLGQLSIAARRMLPSKPTAPDGRGVVASEILN